jgi:4-hydroxymandelate oxidase
MKLSLPWETDWLSLSDGGFRWGSDVIKASAFGGTLVGLGRPILYGLGADGREGVRRVIAEISGEMTRIMCLVGAVHPDDLCKDMVIEDP